MTETGISVKRYNRWIPVIAGIAAQLCLGTAYIWGVFQVALIAKFGWKNTVAAVAFSLLLGVLTFGSTIGGLIQDRFSPRPVLIAGGLILGLGFFLASFTTESTVWWLWLTYGVLGGFGMGMTYTTTISCCQKWFPDKRGLITGIIVSALGFGGLVFTPIAQRLIDTRGVLETFAWLGLIFVVVSTIVGLIMKNPPAGWTPPGWTRPAPKAGMHHQEFKPSEVLRTPQFYLVITAFMFATASGLMVIPFAKALGLAGDNPLPVAVATAGVMVISAFNSFGRLFWGWMSDKLGRKNTLMLLMILAGISILFVAAAQSYWILVLIAVVGFSYGGFLGIFPAMTADFWGQKNMGVNYGMVLLGFGVGAVASSYIAGYFRDQGTYNYALYIASAAAFAGVIIMLFLKNPKLKKESK